MADTGAPWNLPYPLPTDLVRDGADAIKDLAEATADGLDAAGNAGIGPNVVSVVKSDVFETTSATFVPVTGLAATITPTSADSKVLVVVSVMSSTTSNALSTVFRVVRDSTAIGLGDAAGSRVRATFRGMAAFGSTNTVVLEDTPNTTDPVTYTVETGGYTSGQTTRINRELTDADNANLSNGRTASFITLIEVAE